MNTESCIELHSFNNRIDVSAISHLVPRIISFLETVQIPLINRESIKATLVSNPCNTRFLLGISRNLFFNVRSLLLYSVLFVSTYSN